MRVRLDAVRKSFGDLEVVKGLDLEVAEGEFLVLLGPSGCGKTTALRMVAGLESVTSGRIHIGERDVTDVLPKHRDVAMVFQSYALYPHMRVAENIGYPLKVRKVAAEEIRRRVEAAAAKVDLAPYLDRYPRQLSGGQRQRVALARAMVRTPSLFLMDEPLSNLDAKLRGHMRAELKHLQRELGVTTIYVTHDQIEAMTLAHRVAVMHAGVVQQIDTPREIYSNPANLFVAGFMGSPPMNLLQGEISPNGFEARGGRVPLSGFRAGSGVTIGFRPEDTQFCDPDAAHFSGTVYSSEMTGNETIVTCRIGGETVVVRTDKDFEPEIDAPAHLALDLEKVCLFDTESGRRLHQETEKTQA
ncbi:MAG: ABC transporter ATP-binding protein [Pseudomonadota bacterium]